MKHFLTVMALVVVVAMLPDHYLEAVGTKQPVYCYLCRKAYESETGDYPCMVCEHPNSGPRAVKSCVPYCNETCTVGLACGETALQNSIVQPDGSRLNLVLQWKVGHDVEWVGDTTPLFSLGARSEVMRTCGEAIAAEALGRAALEQRIASLAQITL